MTKEKTKIKKFRKVVNCYYPDGSFFGHNRFIFYLFTIIMFPIWLLLSPLIYLKDYAGTVNVYYEEVKQNV